MQSRVAWKWKTLPAHVVNVSPKLWWWSAFSSSICRFPIFAYLVHQDQHIHTGGQRRHVDEVFHLIQERKGTMFPSLGVCWRGSGCISSPSKPLKDHPNPIFAFVYSVSLCLKLMKISPVKFPGRRVDTLWPRWGHPIHTQVPWWCTVCLRCFRPSPLSLKSITRCCDVSTRALAMAIPRSPERKEKYINMLL